MVSTISLWSAAPGRAQQDVPEVVLRLLEEGRRQQQEGRLERAVETLSEALRLGPDTVPVYLDLGAARARLGQIDLAVETFEKGLGIEPDNRGLLYNAAVLRLRQGDSEIALKHVDKALESDADAADLLQVRAGCLVRLDRQDEALAALRRAETAEPRSARLQFAVGNQLHRMGRLSEAADAFGKALRLDKKMTRASYNLGAVLVELGRYEEARKAYEDALAPLQRALAKGETVDTIHAVAFANLGAAYSQTAKWDNAANAYRAAAQIDPSFAEAQLNLGYALFQRKKWKESGRAYKKAVELDPGLSLAYLQLGEISYAQGNCESAIRWLEEGLGRLQAEGRLTAMERMARCYTELDRPEDAEQVFRRVLAEAPSDPNVLTDFGAVLRRNGRLEEAWQTLSRSLELRDGLRTRLEALAVAEAAGREDDRRRLLRSIDVEKDPRLWPLRREVAVLDLGAGRWAEAAETLGALAALDGVPAEEKGWASGWASIASWLAGDASRDGLRAELPYLQLVREAEAGRVDAALQMAADLPDVGPVLWARTFLDWQQGRDAAASRHLAAARKTGDGGLAAGGPAAGVIAAELDYQAGSFPSAAEGFAAATEACAAPSREPQAKIETGAGKAYIAVARPPGQALCAFAAARLPGARLQAGIAELRRAPSAAVEVARSVVASGAATAEQRAAARFIEGTSLLAQGAPRRAVSALQEALDGSLPEAWRDAAWINLGVARAELGAVDEALRCFSEASGPDAVLNAAILRHDRLNDPQGALDLYETYLRLGGPRRQQVEAWAEPLRELYR